MALNNVDFPTFGNPTIPIDSPITSPFTIEFYTITDNPNGLTKEFQYNFI